MFILQSVILFCHLFVVLHEAKQHSSRPYYANASGFLRGKFKDWPIKCHCMALGHGSLHVRDHSWQSDEAWSVESPRGFIDSDIQGRDMVCTGRGTVPWPLPDGKLKQCPEIRSTSKFIMAYLIETFLECKRFLNIAFGMCLVRGLIRRTDIKATPGRV